MPTKEQCDKIKDPTERAKCKAYKGKYAKKQKKSKSKLSIQDQVIEELSDY